MKNKIVLRETAAVAAGIAALSLVTAGCFLALGRFNSNVLLGILAGSLVAVGNFLLLSLTAAVAADKAARNELRQARNLLQLSTLARLFAMAVLLGLCLKLGANPLALVLPPLFTRPILRLWGLLEKRKTYERN